MPTDLPDRNTQTLRYGEATQANLRKRLREASNAQSLTGTILQTVNRYWAQNPQATQAEIRQALDHVRNLFEAAQ